MQEQAETQELIDEVRVDLATDAGEPRYRAAGFLHGLAGLYDEPDLVRRRAAPLKVRCVRSVASSCWQQAPVCAELGIRQIAIISCDWGFGIYAPHPGDGDEWKAWEMLIEKVVAARRKEGVAVMWDIWNEPDYAAFWRRSPEQFLETWLRAHRLLHELDPEMPIVGPQWSGQMKIEGEYFQRFLRFGIEHDCLPDYFDWHFPKDIVKEAQFCRSLFDRLKIRFKGLYVSEYCDQYQFHAGRMAFEIAQIERARLDQASLASWKSPFGGLYANLKAGTPRGVWWVYRRYAQMTGNLLVTQPSERIELLASTDPEENSVRVLLGHRGGEAARVTLHLEGWNKLPRLAKAGRVRLRVELYPQTDGAHVPEPPVVQTEVLGTREEVLKVSWDWENEQDAYGVIAEPQT